MREVDQIPPRAVLGEKALEASRSNGVALPRVDFDTLGRIAAGILEKIGVPRDADFYLCGPTAFMQDLSAGLVAWGVSGDHVHMEIFGPGKSSTRRTAETPRVLPHLPERPSGPGPQVSFARNSINACWDPKFSSLLDFAEACNAPVRWSCRIGVSASEVARFWRTY